MKRAVCLFFVAVGLVVFLAGCPRNEQMLGGAAVGAVIGAAVMDGVAEGNRRSRNQCWYDYHGRYRCRDAQYYRRPPPRGYYPPRRYNHRYSTPPPQHRNYRDCWRGRYGEVRCR